MTQMSDGQPLPQRRWAILTIALGIIMAVLAPDVQIYDANGNYAPNKANSRKDSLSCRMQSFMRTAGR